MARIVKFEEHGSIIVATLDDGTERYTPKGQFDWRPFDPPRSVQIAGLKDNPAKVRVDDKPTLADAGINKNEAGLRKLGGKKYPRR